MKRFSGMIRRQTNSSMSLPSADGLVWTFQIRKGVKFHDESDILDDLI